MGNGRGKVVLPGGLQGGGRQLVSAEQLLVAHIEQTQWPQVSEWLTMTPCKFGCDVDAKGMREIWMQPMGSSRGYRLPLDAALCRVLVAKMQLLDVPESDEVAAAQAPAPFEPLPSDGEGAAVDDEPPTPPTMGQ